MKSEEEFSIECSDEENFGGVFGANKSLWHPSTNRIVDLYETLDKKDIIELMWKCPGRRSPTPPPTKVNSWQDKKPKDVKTEQTPTAFDFDEFPGESSSGNSKITPRRTPGSAKLKGSGQKRVASFKNVMSDIRRQMKLSQLDKTPVKTPKEKKGKANVSNFRA